MKTDNPNEVDPDAFSHKIKNQADTIVVAKSKYETSYSLVPLVEALACVTN